MNRSNGSILLIEDDKIIGTAIKDFLTFSNYNVILREDGHKGLKEYYSRTFDLVLLDIMLPYTNGYEIAQEIRKDNCTLPIIFISGRDLREDKIKGFKIGADDYIIKPFSMEELRVRIKAVIRRSKYNHHPSDIQTLYKIGEYIFDYKNHLLIFQNEQRRLTRKETDLLHMLANNINEILKRETALKTIWGRNDYFMGRSMDVYISKLRKMFENDPGVAIVNIHNTGFMLTVK